MFSNDIRYKYDYVIYTHIYIINTSVGHNRNNQ